MKTVWKFKLPTVIGRHIVYMDMGARILSVQARPEDWCAWALCDVSAPLEARCIFVLGTGDEVPEGLNYISTFQDGSMVLHAFERVSK